MIGSSVIAGGKTYYWYEGTHKHTVWMSPRLVAEFYRGKLVDSPLKKAYPGAKLHSSPGAFIRLWRLDGTSPDAVAAKMKTEPNETRYSPVFTDRAGGGERRALPGGILVTLDPSWTDSQVQAWLTQHGLVVVRKMEGLPNVMLIQTGPGLEALEKANGLVESGEVVAAEPDWWHEMARK